MGYDGVSPGLTTGQLGITFDKSKKLQNLNLGPKYLVMSRVNFTSNATETLSNISPFLIEKVIDNTCDSEVDICKKLRNGTILIKTKNLSQAQKLIQLTSLAPTIKVSITEHSYLNYTKSVIYSNDLRGISEEDIAAELKEQSVIKVEKIKKKVDSQLIETGLLIITFSSISLPDTILIGYEKIRVRTYIPRPMRCSNRCLYGHTGKFCKNNKMCPNCAQEYHITADANEKCTNNSSCINCKSHNHSPINHNIFDKSCPIFLREKEIQAIITLEKLNRNSAVTLYNQRHGNKESYASVSSSTKNTDSRLPPINVSTTSSNRANRPILKYNDIVQLKKDTLSSLPKHPTSRKITLLPKNTSKRTINQMKKSLSNNKKSPNIFNDDSSDNGDMDLDNT